MNDQDFDFFRALIRRRSAIALDESKRYLIETRLAPIVRLEGLANLAALADRLRTQPPDDLADRVVEALVTTESSFFRDLQPFESLRKVILPELIRRRAREATLNIWSAACAHGQEPYSLVLLLRESFPELASWTIRLLATDLSREALARARSGVYSQIEVNRGLPASLLIKYFRQEGVTWHLDEPIRRAVEFRALNLAEPWPALPKMDLILLRNVMIYFDVETRKEVLGRVGRLLRPDGYLLLGSAETTFFLDSSYRRVEHLRSGFYQHVD